MIYLNEITFKTNNPMEMNDAIFCVFRCRWLLVVGGDV